MSKDNHFGLYSIRSAGSLIRRIVGYQVIIVSNILR